MRTAICPLWTVPAIATCLGFVPQSARAQDPLVVFAFDQTLDIIIRIEDINGDGDTLDPGEVTRFFDDTVPVTGTENSQGLYALDPWTLLATDNFVPDNVILLRDLDRNGDAFGPAESSVWFDGLLPGGYTLTNPVCLSRGPGDAFYMIDNNTLDTANPEAVYRMIDLNDDGDVNDPGEVTHYFQLSPPGVSAATTFDIEFDNLGAGYVLDITDPNQIESIDRIDPAATTRTEYLSSQTLFNITGDLLFSGGFELTWDHDRNRLIASAVNLANATIFIALTDRNGNNVIDNFTEIRRIWGEPTHADGFSTGTPRDVVYAPDGSLIWTDAFTDRIWRLYDINMDGDYNDLGETTFIYDSAAAGAAGQPSIPLMLSCAVTRAVRNTCPDLDGDGNVDLNDFATLALCFGGTGVTDPPLGCPLADFLAADCDGDGDVDLNDFASFATAFPG